MMAKTSKSTEKNKDNNKATPKTKKKRPSWDVRLQECRAFREAHGHLKIPTSYKENKGLGVWVQELRRNYKLLKSGQPPRSKALTDERIQQLQELGFDWGKFTVDPKKCAESDASWEGNFERCREYYEAHGNLDVPLDQKETEDLAKWVRAQRHFNKQRVSKVKCFGFSTKRFRKLDELGMDWDGPKDW